MSAAVSQLKSYIQLTKPTIVLLVAITGLATMAAEGSLFESPVKMLLILGAIVLSAGSANAFNQYIDRDIDALMERTRKKRPLPLKNLRAFQVFAFAFLLAVVSTAYLWWAANLMAAMISLATILFYTVIYTLWLKRRHHYNIVIGGAAGAAAPLIASAAVYGEPSALSWILFGIIFLWTPAHFWALALAIKDEYGEVNVPMLPNVLGDQRTRKEIFIYTLTLLPITIIPFSMGLIGPFALICGLFLWVWYLKETVRRFREGTQKAYKLLFLVSIVYLFFFFIAIGFDGALRHFGLFS